MSDGRLTHAVLRQGLIAAGTAALVLGCAPPPQPTVNYPGTAPAPTSASAPVPPPVAPAPIPAPSPAPPPPATGTPSVAPAVPQPAEPSAAEVALANGVSAYERGEFAQAIRLLTPLGNDASLSVAQRVRALKFLAFSQCVTGAVGACRTSFERAFRLDPGFDLARTEHGHPVWGPQFERARRNVLGR
ncbi:MAG: TssQ family T6SS-associated lipoprotein [Casimicrobiaceae bacterium]|nr:TssQ family T6SS-associated lipoprotein [Casimicrobiaceae bacterium]MDW8312593.1 TssQ family T6SS-associated lipoprotein [Burkholderiales bacterium]